MVAHTTVKTSQVEYFARSAIAPLIRATVMMANTAWKATNASAGMPPWAGIPFAAAWYPKMAASPLRRLLRPKCWNGLPINPCQELPNASL